MLYSPRSKVSRPLSISAGTADFIEFAEINPYFFTNFPDVMLVTLPSLPMALSVSACFSGSWYNKSSYIGDDISIILQTADFIRIQTVKAVS